jgi:U32 family peptidase
MQISRKDIELMAPAGSFESLMAAIQGGADSVYFGLDKLNMRARSSFSFTENDLSEIVNISRQHGVKTYLALNTVVYDDELQILRQIIKQAKKAKIDAIIASDQSVIMLAREENIETHLSTQLNISNFESLKFYRNFADVVVPARELSLEQIKGIINSIRKNNITGPSGNLIKIELFIHGALCMAFSGKCYISLHQYGYSANRGECFQACRRSYLLTDKETGLELEVDNEFILSPRDLCTISFVDKIIESGVSVLKIEGRARSPEYVKTVTSCYSEAINAYLNGTFNTDEIKKWETKLRTVFNKGFWEGYYLGRKTTEWSTIYGSAATKKKIYIGKGVKYYAQINVAEFILENESLISGDEILITGPTTGVIQTVIKEIRTDNGSVGKVIKGENFSIPLNEVIRPSDKLYKIVDSDA